MPDPTVSQPDQPSEEFSPVDVRVFGHPLAVQRPPLCPEILLWLLDGEVDLNARCTELLDATSLPFWAFCWGSGQALSRYILDHPSEVASKTVVDFGAGSAVVAIAAAMAGARSVTAVDIDPVARRFSAENAKLNGVPIAVSESTPEAWDVLIAGDVLYEDANRAWLCGMAERKKTPDRGRRGRQAARRDRTVLIADPQRNVAARLPIEPIARVEARTFPDVDYPLQSTAIYRLAPRSPQ